MRAGERIGVLACVGGCGWCVRARWCACVCALLCACCVCVCVRERDWPFKRVVCLSSLWLKFEMLSMEKFQPRFWWNIGHHCFAINKVEETFAFILSKTQNWLRYRCFTNLFSYEAWFSLNYSRAVISSKIRWLTPSTRIYCVRRFKYRWRQLFLYFLNSTWYLREK